MSMQSLLRKIYLRYLEYRDVAYFSFALYGLVFLVSVLLIISVIVPQISNWVSLRAEVDSTRERIATMNDNVAYLLAQNQSQLEDDLSVVTTALPPERDVSGLIVAINIAAVNAGVVLEDFSFQPGEVSSRSTASRDTPTSGTAKITFSVQGSLPQTTKLLSELHQKIPLLSIDSINAQFMGNNRTRITVQYYYKTLPLIPEEHDKRLKDLTPQERTLLEKLKSWQVSQIQFAPQNGSASGGITPF